jgi:hypothetical protein
MCFLWGTDKPIELSWVLNKRQDDGWGLDTQYLQNRYRLRHLGRLYYSGLCQHVVSQIFTEATSSRVRLHGVTSQESSNLYRSPSPEPQISPRYCNLADDIYAYNLSHLPSPLRPRSHPRCHRVNLSLNLSLYIHAYQYPDHRALCLPFQSLLFFQLSTFLPFQWWLVLNERLR